MIDDGDVRIVQGDALEQLALMPSESVHCIVTSPPFWALRDYGMDGQIGLEATPEAWCQRLVDVFRECRRVLRADGVMWLECGTTFYGGPENRFRFTATDAAYMAAIIDGEGCIQIHRQARSGSVDSFQVDVSVAMKPRDVVAWCHETSGIGSLTSYDREQYGVNWDWSVRGSQAADLLRTLYPYLRLKRRQAALAIALAEDIQNERGHRVRPISDDVIERRDAFKRAVSDLNQYRDPPIPIPEPAAAPPLGLKVKDDVMAPATLALALRADGWYLRSDTIWARPNPMPESVTDRPTKAHSYVFLLTKSARYFYDADAVREAHGDTNISRHAALERSNGDRGEPVAGAKHESSPYHKQTDFRGVPGVGTTFGEFNPAGRNARSVWTIPTEPTPFAHFATFPQALVERCIKAGTSEHGCCSECGAPWVRQTEASQEYAESLASRPRKDEFDADEFARYLRDQRINCGHSQKHAAGIIGVGQQAWSWWEIGRNVPRWDLYVEIKSLLHLDDRFDEQLRAYRFTITGDWSESGTLEGGKRAGMSGVASRVANYETTGWAPSCTHDAPVTPCTVLDPFMGSGTTALVARRLGRRAIGIELNSSYIEIAATRLQQLSLLGGAA